MQSDGVDPFIFGITTLVLAYFVGYYFGMACHSSTPIAINERNQCNFLCNNCGSADCGRTSSRGFSPSYGVLRRGVFFN